MRDPSVVDGLFVIMVLLVGIVVGCLVGGCTAKEAQRAEAVKAGVAHYEIDAKSGEARFVFGVPSYR